MPEWLIVAIKEYLFVKETSSSTVMGTTRCSFDSDWVQLNKSTSLTSYHIDWRTGRVGLLK